MNNITCSNCGSDEVKLANGEDRTREVLKHTTFHIPFHVKIPTCQKCGEIFFTQELSKEIFLMFFNSEFKTIKQKIEDGEVLSNSDLLDHIDLWHDSVYLEMELNEFLGMSQEEYAKWVENPSFFDDLKIKWINNKNSA